MNVQNQQQGQGCAVGTAHPDKNVTGPEHQGCEQTAQSEECAAASQTPRPRTPDEVIDAACYITGVTYEELTGRCRRWDCVLARALVYTYLRNNTRMSTSAIGNLVNRDHATVLNGLKRLQGWLDSGEVMIKDINQLFNERIYVI